MGVLTNLLKLLKPGENDYYNQQTEQADNWQKVDDYAVLTNADKNGIWGGEYGGKIQDPIPKELNKRYIDNINGKAFICIKAGDSSVVSNTIEYFTPCNVVDNLGKLQNLTIYDNLFEGNIIIDDNKKTATINTTKNISDYAFISIFAGDGTSETSDSNVFIFDTRSIMKNKVFQFTIQDSNVGGVTKANTEILYCRYIDDRTLKVITTNFSITGLNLKIYEINGILKIK